MEILIKTFVLGANHGQYLQALGLSRQVKRINSKIKIYHPFHHNHFFKELLIHINRGSIIKFFSFMFFWFKRFKFVSKNKKFPIVIYGSDMVWHFQSNLFRPDIYYFQKNHVDEISISFAPSTSWRNIYKEPSFKSLISKFQHVSVRDNSTFDLVNEVSNISPSIVCDPAFFILDNNLVKQTTSRKNEYKLNVGIYGHSKVFDPIINNYSDLFGNASIESFTYRKRIDYFLRFYEQFSDPLNIIKSYQNKDFIFTNTFHGIILALISRKPFLAIASKNLYSRIEIYKNFFYEKRILREEYFSIDNLDFDYLLETKDIKYDELNKFIESSKNWLSKYLSKYL